LVDSAFGNTSPRPPRPLYRDALNRHGGGILLIGMLVRIAALVSVGAPPASYLLNLGAASEVSGSIAMSWPRSVREAGDLHMRILRG
jgi:hypothetical protein